MDFVVRQFAPSEVEFYSGVDTVRLRDWRRKGYLEGYGFQNPAGRWRYSLSECISLSLMRVLEWNGQPFARLAFISEALSLTLINAVRGWGVEGLPGERFFVFWPEDVGNPEVTRPGFGIQYLSTNDLAEIVNAGAPQAIVVDVERLAEALPEPLLGAIRAGASDA